MQEQQGQEESPDVMVMRDVMVMLDARVIRSISWRRVSTEVRARPDERTIVELLNEHSGLKARIELRQRHAYIEGRPGRVARVEFMHEREAIAEATAMYAVGDVFMIRGTAMYAVHVAPLAVTRRPLSGEPGDPASHVGATWFEIDGQDITHVLGQLFGDALSEAL